MDSLESIIIKLQDSRIHLDNNDVTSAKWSITGGIEELTVLMMNLENVAEQPTDVAAGYDSADFE